MDYQQAKETADAPLSYAVYDSQGYATAFWPERQPCHKLGEQPPPCAQPVRRFRHRTPLQPRLETQSRIRLHSRSRFRQPYGVAGVLSIDHNTAATDLNSRLLARRPAHPQRQRVIDRQIPPVRPRTRFNRGINGYKYASNKHGERSIIPNAIPNAYEFSHGCLPAACIVCPNHPAHGTRRQIGGYLATCFRAADNLSLILGGRYTCYRTAGYDSRTQGMTYVSANRFTPYTGIVSRPDLQPVALRLVQQSACSSRNRKDEHGSYLKPGNRRNNWKLKIKGEWLEAV